MFTAKFEIKETESLYDALVAEQESLITKRAQVSISKETDIIIITITANDFVAFRALESAIMRLLTTYYKVKSIGE